MSEPLNLTCQHKQLVEVRNGELCAALEAAVMVIVGIIPLNLKERETIQKCKRENLREVIDFGEREHTLNEWKLSWEKSHEVRGLSDTSAT